MISVKRGLAGFKQTPPDIYCSCDFLLFISESLFVLLFVLGKSLNGGIKEFKFGIPENCLKKFL